jgi:hypothetical protein
MCFELHCIEMYTPVRCKESSTLNDRGELYFGGVDTVAGFAKYDNWPRRVNKPELILLILIYWFVPRTLEQYSSFFP